jgi:hypothetical protein
VSAAAAAAAAAPPLSAVPTRMLMRS